MKKWREKKIMEEGFEQNLFPPGVLYSIKNWKGEMF